MPSIITDLCLRDGACVSVCPVDCIVAGNPVTEWPHYYIDIEVCINCSACIPECPQGAIYPQPEVPTRFIAQGGERVSMPYGTPGFDQVYEQLDHNGYPIRLEATRVLLEGEEIDLTPAISQNIAFFEEGPGYESGINSL